MNLWHDISNDTQLKAIIEIPKNTCIKYEMDKLTGLLVADRVVAQSYPQMYGFIPRTLSEDNDPLDVFIISRYVLDIGVPLSQVKIEPLAIINTNDNGETDPKIVAKIVGDNTFGSLDLHLNTLTEFLKSYKDGLIVTSIGNVEEANKVIDESKKRYNNYLISKNIEAEIEAEDKFYG